MPVLLILVYLTTFVAVDNKRGSRETLLQHTLPAPVQKIMSGYLYQVVSELLFIKAGVFLGGVAPGTPSASYSDALANNLSVATELYPEFMDSYYYAASHLAPLSKEAAAEANIILQRGITTYPGDLTLHFFKAFNYNFYLDQPLESAAAFNAASLIPDAPPLFKRLAAIFSARGGDLKAGRSMLEVMLAAEEDYNVKQRYQHEIKAFDKALRVQRALNAYRQKYFYDPITLNFLVPEFIEEIPHIWGSFILTYELGMLRLVRP